MIVSWPAKIKDKGGLRSQFMHVIDVVPTIYELTGISAPTTLNGVQQAPIEGISFAYTFDDAKAKSRRTTQYFEMFVNRGIYHEGWMASALSFPPWQSVRGAFDPDKQKWELYQHRRGLQPSQRRRSGKSGKAARAAGPVVGGGGEVQRPPARLARRRTV